MKEALKTVGAAWGQGSASLFSGYLSPSLTLSPFFLYLYNLIRQTGFPSIAFPHKLNSKRGFRVIPLSQQVKNIPIDVKVKSATLFNRN